MQFSKVNVGITITRHILRRTAMYMEIVVFTASFLMFYYMMYHVRTDIQVHAVTIKDVAQGHMLPPANFLYYLTVYTFSLFSTNIDNLLFTSSLVLSAAVSAKLSVTKLIFKDYLQLKGNSRLLKLTLLLTSMLLIVFNLPKEFSLEGRFYLGQIPPNIWHNSTTIFLMPFALYLFWLSYKQLTSPATNRIAYISFVCVVNILIKPSFFFVFSVAYPVMLIIRFGMRDKMFINLVPVVIGVILIYAESYFIYIMNFGNLYADKAGIEINPFHVWSFFSSSIFLSVVVSTVFPLTFMLTHYRQVWRNMLWQYAIISFIVAVVIFTLFTETGAREFHGNFFWQCVVCNYVLFTVTSILLVEDISLSKVVRLKSKLALLSFGVHVIAGIVYLYKLLTVGSFL